MPVFSPGPVVLVEGSVPYSEDNHPPCPGVSEPRGADPTWASAPPGARLGQRRGPSGPDALPLPRRPVPGSVSRSCVHGQRLGHKAKVQKFQILWKVIPHVGAVSRSRLPELRFCGDLPISGWGKGGGTHGGTLGACKSGAVAVLRGAVPTSPRSPRRHGGWRSWAGTRQPLPSAVMSGAERPRCRPEGSCLHVICSQSDQRLSPGLLAWSDERRVCVSRRFGRSAFGGWHRCSLRLVPSEGSALTGASPLFTEASGRARVALWPPPGPAPLLGLVSLLMGA